MTFSWTFHPVREFGAHQDQWEEINLAGPSSPLLSSRFVASAIAQFAEGDERIALGKRDGEAVAMTVVQHIGRGKWEVFKPSQAPLGLIVKRASVGIGEVLGSLMASIPGMPLVVGLSCQDPDLVPRPEGSGNIDTLDFIHTARVLVNGSFDDYWKARDGKLRQETNRRLRRLGEAGIEPRLELIKDSAAAAAGIADFGRLESAGWKGREGTAINADNEQGDFYKSLLESFCEVGMGRIYRYWFGDKLAAMQLCIEGGRTIVFLKTTYDESFKNYGPGILMQHAIMQGLFAEGRFDKVEFYGRSGQPQTKWCDNQIRTMYHVNYYRWPFLQKLKRIMASRAADRAESAGTP